ncbi:helix-turn-helix transcriptional regulator [Nonomuraea sp. NPDC050310]|uniref:helix-turn-helix transcriptional regulator n=1 Tax=unclassified Nonomuraea TaxID=2593643 RepID=UPI0033E922D1
MPQIPLLQAFAEVGFQVAGRGGAHAAMDALTKIVPHRAFELVAYDPASGRHRSLVGRGFPGVDTEEYVNLEGYRRARASGLPIEMPGRFRGAWAAAMTAPLVLKEGRYTGLLHLAASAPFGEEAAGLVAALAPTLAHLTDLSRPKVDPIGVPDGYRATAFDRAGTRREVPGCEPVAAGRELGVLAREFIDSRELSRSGLWQDAEGGWHQVRMVRAAVGVNGTIQGAVLTERPCGLPYELTGREVEVLTRVAAGDSNPQIAAALVLSVRTVTTHLEHIFAKLGCDSRTRLTTKALAEGLCRL